MQSNGKWWTRNHFRHFLRWSKKSFMDNCDCLCSSLCILALTASCSNFFLQIKSENTFTLIFTEVQKESACTTAKFIIDDNFISETFELSKERISLINFTHKHKLRNLIHFSHESFFTMHELTLPYEKAKRNEKFLREIYIFVYVLSKNGEIFMSRSSPCYARHVLYEK